MKNIFLLCSFSFMVFVYSCDQTGFDKDGDKLEWQKDKKDFGCAPVDCPTCDDSAYNHPDDVAEDIEVFILEPLEISETCGCIVGGFVKYLKAGKTAALVKYAGECSGIGYKTICVNGDCEDKKAWTCQFELACEN